MGQLFRTRRIVRNAGKRLELCPRIRRIIIPYSAGSYAHETAIRRMRGQSIIGCGRVRIFPGFHDFPRKPSIYGYDSISSKI